LQSRQCNPEIQLNKKSGIDPAQRETAAAMAFVRMQIIATLAKCLQKQQVLAFRWKSE
jgi:hypothetical protein